MRCASRGDHKGRPYSRPRWSDGLRLIIIAETELRIGWRRGHDSPAGGLRGAPLQNSVFACEKRGISFCQNRGSGATAFGRCVGNTTRAATLDSMREVPTWPHAPPAPWAPRHHPGVGGERRRFFRGLFRADRNLHDEARAEFAARRYDNASSARGGAAGSPQAPP
jgi:hypothetical protein